MTDNTKKKNSKRPAANTEKRKMHQHSKTKQKHKVCENQRVSQKGMLPKVHSLMQGYLQIGAEHRPL